MSCNRAGFFSRQIYLEVTKPDEQTESGFRTDRIAVLLFGNRASGKSTLAGGDDGIAERIGGKVLDPDLAKVLIPEYDGGIGDAAVHREACAIVDNVLARVVARGWNFVQVLDCCDSEELLGRAAALRAAGYTVHIVFVDLDANEAARRAISRWQKTGQFVDPDLIVNIVAERPRLAYHALRKIESCDSLTWFDNNVEHGQPVRFVEGRGDFVRLWFSAR